MSAPRLLQVKILNRDATISDTELRRLEEFIRESLEEWGMDDEYEAFITGSDLEITELPGLDEYTDELAERVAEEVNKPRDREEHPK